MYFWLFVLLLVVVYAIWDLTESYMAYKFGVNKKDKQKKKKGE